MAKESAKLICDLAAGWVMILQTFLQLECFFCLCILFITNIENILHWVSYLTQSTKLYTIQVVSFKFNLSIYTHLSCYEWNFSDVLICDLSNIMPHLATQVLIIYPTCVRGITYLSSEVIYILRGEAEEDIILPRRINMLSPVH